MPTPHISAKQNEIAPLVVMSGDPLRAKFIAESFLTDVKQVNAVRNMFAFTGKYKGKRITVMGHGMGMGSACIYFHELFEFYNVQKIIRVGSCGALRDDLDLFDTIIVKSAMTDSNIGRLLGVKSRHLPCDENMLVNAIKNSNIESDSTVKVGDIYTTDVFYNPNDKPNIKFRKKGAYAVEMESYGLYAEAIRTGKQALSIVTVSDIIGKTKATTSAEREKSFTKMMNLALETIVM